jgi:YVTN family beta-propeller protein
LLAAVVALSAARALAAPLAYVADHADDTVTIIDAATNGTVGTIPVGHHPYGVAVDPEGAHVYVGNLDGNSVSVITTSTKNVVDLPVGDTPTGVAVKLPGTRVYVANRNDATVSVIDPATNQVLTTIGVGTGPMSIAVNPAGTPAYVVNRGDDSMSVIDTGTNEVLTTVPVGLKPTHVAVSPAGDKLYVTDNAGTMVSVVNATTLEVTGTIAVGAYPEGVAFSPDGALAYVVNSGPETLSVIDTAAEAIIVDIPVGNNAEDVSVRPDGKRVYVLNRGEKSVSVIDPVALHEVDVDANDVNGLTRITVGAGPVARGNAFAPPLAPPRFSKLAVACQGVIAAQARAFAATDQGTRATCLNKILKDVADGKGSQAGEATCALALDLQNSKSTLGKARTTAHDTIIKKCTGINIAALNHPCAHEASSFSEAADCILDQHETRVHEMSSDTFATDDAHPMPKAARACQATLAKGATQLARSEHAQLDGCLLGLLKDTAKQKGLAGATAKCRKTLDPNDPKASVPKIRAAALTKVAKKCAGLTPADIGAPCNPTGSTIAQTAACVFASQTMRVEKMVAAEFNDACPMLTGVGLGRAYPDVCSGR